MVENPAATGLVSIAVPGEGKKTAVEMSQVMPANSNRKPIDAPSVSAEPRLANVLETNGLDGELISLCARLIALEAEEGRLLKAGTGIEAALEDSIREWQEIEQRMYQLGLPQTAEGARAIARAALTVADKREDGSLDPKDFGTWLSLMAASYLARNQS